ncbi:MAG: hypothetical protein ACRDWH_09060, partial [Acidimicrobiia bacterium]
GVDRLAGFVPDGWEPSLASLFAGVGITEVFAGWSGEPPPTPVVMDHLGDVVTIIPLGVPFAAALTERIWPRLEPPVDRTWVRTLNEVPEAGLLYRKMLRLANNLPERVPPEAAEQIAGAQSANWYTADPDRAPAHAALAAARHRIDLTRRRSEDWTLLTVLDWDADGSDEIQLETSDLSLVVDPGAGLLLYLDHKPRMRPVTYLPGQAPCHLAHTMTGDQASLIKFELSGVEEARGRAGAILAGEGIEMAVAVGTNRIELTYRITEASPWQRLGPEIPFAFSDTPRVRVDGSDWTSVTDPVAISGHRFRLERHDERVLVTAHQPADFFLRPVSGGAVLWSNWPLIRDAHVGTEVLGAEYRLTVEILG